MTSTPLDPFTRPEWEYRVTVMQQPLSFQTAWQLPSYAMVTHDRLREAFPDATIALHKRRISQAQQVLEVS